MDRKLEIQRYMDMCLYFEMQSPYYYWIYVHGYWLNQLWNDRVAGKMSKGKFTYDLNRHLQVKRRLK